MKHETVKKVIEYNDQLNGSENLIKILNGNFNIELKVNSIENGSIGYSTANIAHDNRYEDIKNDLINFLKVKSREYSDKYKQEIEKL